MANAFQRAAPRSPIIKGNDERHEEFPVFQEDRSSVLSFFQRVVPAIVGVLTISLSVRFVLALFGANPANGFVNATYKLTDPLMAPFDGIFGLETTSGASRFEIGTLVAIIVYVLLGVVLVRLLGLPRRS